MSRFFGIFGQKIRLVGIFGQKIRLVGIFGQKIRFLDFWGFKNKKNAHLRFKFHENDNEIINFKEITFLKNKNIFKNSKTYFWIYPNFRED